MAMPTAVGAETFSLLALAKFNSHVALSLVRTCESVALPSRPQNHGTISCTPVALRNTLVII